MSTTRPKDEEELQKREAVGVIRASRFVRQYARSHESISIKTVADIHNEIFEYAWPEIAGKYREENLTITDSEHIPPHFSDVPHLMALGDIEFTKQLETLKKCEGIIFDIRESDITDELIDCVDRVVRVAAWLHHTITFIHPFREGNGRTARLAANLILERYGLVGISVKVEKENKNGYRLALAQIDKHKDYEPLVGIIYEGLTERYNGVSMKYYEV